MRIATWNINSIRARIDRLTAWLERSDVDVLAIQETKIADDKFPADAFADLGYQVAHHGTNQWNGVAVLSRVGVDDVADRRPRAAGVRRSGGHRGQGDQAVCGGVRVWSLYIPNGRAVGDPHYYYKLEWLAAIRDYGAEALADDPQVQIALCGDFNIAPTDDDIWSVEYYRDSTHVTPAGAAGIRQHRRRRVRRRGPPAHPGPGVYTYWDYTQLASRSDAACGSTSPWPARRWPPG